MPQEVPTIEEARQGAATHGGRTALLVALAVVALALLSGGAVAGWVQHGEAIFLHLLEAGWAACF